MVYTTATETLHLNHSIITPPLSNELIGHRAF